MGMLMAMTMLKMKEEAAKKAEEPKVEASAEEEIPFTEPEEPVEEPAKKPGRKPNATRTTANRRRTTRK